MLYHKILPIILSFISFVSLSYCTYVSNPASTSVSPADVSPSSASPSSVSPADVSPTDASTGSIVVTFDYARQSGSASNQFAIWIEDANHEYITTLYATRYTANGGYKVRPDSIYEWVEKSGLADMSITEVDAVSGATPGAGTLTYTWDLTGADGKAVPDGGYFILVEGTLRWKNRVLYTGYIEVGGEPVAFDLEPQYTYSGAGNQPALNDDSPENNMLAAVSLRYIPTNG